MTASRQIKPSTPAHPTLSRKQLRAIAQSTGRVNIWEGSIRSGKTFSSILAWVTFLSLIPIKGHAVPKVPAGVPDPPLNGELVMVGKNVDSIYRNVFAPIEKDPALAWLAQHVKYKQGANVAHIMGHRVNVIGANDDRAESRIRGMTVAAAYVDEITVLPMNFFKQLLGRMSAAGARLFGTTNPDSPAHWLKVDYLDKLEELPNWRRFHFVMDDNPSLTEEYKNDLKREYTGLWYRRFILGLWVSAEGAIYDMWAPEEGHVIPWASLPQMQDIFAVGIDYGTTNPTAAVMLGLGVDGRLYLIDEWRHDNVEGQLRPTDADLSKGLRDWLAENHLPYKNWLKPTYIIVDPSAASFQAQLRKDGVNGIASADNDVLYGIRTVSSLLSQRLLITSDRCKGWISEAPGYSWDPKASKNGEDKPIKAADHSCDAVRYVITTTERLWTNRLDYNLAA